jgi:hypothetical protein
MRMAKACHRDPAQRCQNVRAAMEDLVPLAGLIGLRHLHPGSAARRTTKVVLSYNGENLEPLQKLLEKFANEAKALGIELTPIDFNAQ